MRGKELLDRMELVDPAYVEAAEREPALEKRVVRRKRLSRLAAAAAIAALMSASMAVGALAFSTETVVEIPAKQEAIVLEELGLTLLLPDDWEGRYEVVQEVFEPYQSPMWTVAVKSIYDAGDTDAWGTRYMGMLFTVFRCADAPMSREEFEEDSGIAGIGRYLFATENATYAILYATDVQFDTSDPEKTKAYQTEYNALATGMKDIRIVVEHALTEQP